VNNARLKQIEEAQTGVARKVLSAVPIVEAWTSKQIMMEVMRSGSSIDPRTVDGCIATLVDAGLVKRFTAGTYQRVAPKPEAPKGVLIERANAATKATADTMVDMTAAATKAGDALGRLGAVAATLRAKAREFDQLAGEVEEAALAMEDRVTQASADGATLQQFKDLFAKISK
jgi:hypothetical protein